MRLFLLALTACAPLGATPSPPPGSAPLGLTLTAAYGEARVVGALPGEELVLLVSHRGPGLGPCPPLLAGTCLGLVPPPGRLIRMHATADADGVAVWTAPSGLSDQPELWFQAVSTTGRAVSNVADDSRLHCVHDVFEPSDPIPVEVGPGRWTDLQVCPGEADRYEVIVQPGEMLTLRIEGQELLTSMRGVDAYTVTPNGHVGFVHNQGPWEQTVQVAAFGSARPADYVLDVQHASLGSCTDDAFEPDDTLTTARALVDEADGRLCSGNSDWFRVDLQPRDALLLTLDRELEGGFLTMELHFPSGEMIEETYQDQLVYTSLLGGPVYVRIRSTEWSPDHVGRGIGYILQTTTLPDVCQEDPNSPNHTENDATPLADGLQGVACAGAPDVFRADVVEGETLDVRLGTDAVAHGPSLRIDDATVSAEYDVVSETYRIVAPSDGTVFMEVTTQGNPAPYELHVQRRLPSPCVEDIFEPNDAPGLAHLLTPADPTRAATLCEGDVDHFAVFAEEGSRVVVEVEPSDALYSLYNLGLSIVGPLGVELPLGAIAANTGVHTVRIENLHGHPEVPVEYRITAAEDARAQCVPESYEPNDDVTEAAVVQGNFSGMRCIGDDDVYELSVSPDHLVTVDVESSSIYQGGWLTHPDRPWSYVEFPATEYSPDGRLWLRLDGVNSRGVPLPYNVRVASVPAPMCTDDALEPNEDDGSATPLTGSVSAMACPSSEDWYRVEVQAGTVVEWSVSGEVEAWLLSTDALAAYASSGNPLIDTRHALEGGTLWGDESVDEVWFLKVRAASVDPQPYDLHVWSRPWPQAPVDADEPNDVSAFALGRSDARLVHVGPGDPVDTYSVAVAAGDRLRVGVTPADVPAALSTTVRDPMGWRTWSFGSPWEADVVAATAGVYTIEVEWSPRGPHAVVPYSLEVLVTP